LSSRISQDPSDADYQIYPFYQHDITWPIDNRDFKSTEYNIESIIPPPNWRQRYPEWTAESLEHFNLNEHFKVWMRVVATPDFKKLYGRNDAKVLERGLWRISIVDGNVKLQGHGPFFLKECPRSISIGEI
jgi:hypothetical protein